MVAQPHTRLVLQFACWNLASCPDKMAKLQQENDAHPGAYMEDSSAPTACLGAQHACCPMLRHLAAVFHAAWSHLYLTADTHGAFGNRLAVLYRGP